jgi:hypothetical protein
MPIDACNHEPVRADASFHPVLFYTLSIAIAWIAWAPLLLHKLRDLALPVPYPVALFVCQTVGAFAPLLSLFLIQRIKGSRNWSSARSERFADVPLHWILLPASESPP